MSYLGAAEDSQARACACVSEDFISHTGILENSEHSLRLSSGGCEPFADSGKLHNLSAHDI